MKGIISAWQCHSSLLWSARGTEVMARHSFLQTDASRISETKMHTKNPNKVGHQMHENSSFLLFIFHKMAKSVVIHQIENNCSVIPSVYVRDKVCKNNLFKVLSYNYIDYMLDFKKLSMNIKDLDNFYQ